MENIQLLISEIQNRLQSGLSSRLTYHHFDHTLSVVATCNQYIAHYGIDKKQAQLLRLAAWGHDLGFVNTYKDHEVESARLTAELMSKYGYDKDDIQIVESLILATRIPQSPNTLLEKILCDSDLDYLGKANYFPISNTLYQELKSYGVIQDEDHWLDLQISFLKKHHYHTLFARTHLAPQKEQVLQKLQKQKQDSFNSAA